MSIYEKITKKKKLETELLGINNKSQ